MITLFHAIQSLVPGAEVSVGIYDQIITWHKPNTAPVTLEQIQQEQQRLQQAYDWSEYQRNRAREYPAVEEQLDALYHAGVFPPEMSARIRAVKAKYPRPPINQQQWTEQMPVAAVVTPEVTTAPASVGYPTLTPKMTVEEWLTQEAKMTREQWLEKQKNQAQPRQMTREEWLAEQLNLGN
jgi:hypothetical protein